MPWEIVEIDDHINDCLSIVHPILSKYTYPLFAIGSDGRPDLFASCVTVSFDRKILLVTAAHALYEIEKTGSNVYIGRDIIQDIKAKDIRSSKNGRDALDIGVIQIHQDFFERNKLNPLSLESTTLKRVFDQPHLLCMHGYPCTRNKKNKAVDAKKMSFNSYGLTYAGHIPETDNFKRHKKDQNIYYSIKYSVGKDKAGKRLDPPKGKGMSGGGLWVVPNSLRPEKVYLMGILIEQQKDIVYATKIDKVLDFIKNNF